MDHTEYADMHLPERRLTPPALIGIAVAAGFVAVALAGGIALAASGHSRSPGPSATVTASQAKAKKQRARAAAKPKRAPKPAGALVTRDEPVRQRVVVHGHGSIESVVQQGKPGVKRVTRDVASNSVVSSVVVRKSVPTVVARREPAGEKLVALTFDDGPHPTQTREVLRILRAENVRATFFMVGEMARYHPQAARAVADAGMLIGDHTEHHAKLSGKSASKVADEIATGQASIKRITGVTTHWFRSPYGAVNSSTQKAAGRLGMRVATWSVDAEDWKNPRPKAISDYIDKHVRPGSIVLLHDGGGANRASTVAALPAIIKELKRRDYRFVTLDGL